MVILPIILWQTSTSILFLGRVVRREQSSSFAIEQQKKNAQNLRCPSCKSSSIAIELK